MSMHLVTLKEIYFSKPAFLASVISDISGDVSQGSCFGSLLFFINDLQFCLNQGKVSMYTDDTTISHSSKYFSNLDEDLDRDLVKLQNWLHGNKLSSNVTNTQSLIIGCRLSILKLEKHTGVKPNFEIEEQKTHMVSNTKLLGVEIDYKLQWVDQVEQVKAKAQQAQGTIKHEKSFFL